MSDKSRDITLSLKVMIDRERNKVLFAVADNHFADILLSFLSLPLGRIVKVIDTHYGDESATIGSLSSLYRSLSNLDSAYFWSQGAKNILLNPPSSPEAEYERLKLDITDSLPAEYFYCPNNSSHNRFRSASFYYDNLHDCYICYKFGYRNIMRKEVAKKGSEAGSSEAVLTIEKTSFTISDDLQIFPNEMGLLQILTILGITDPHNAEEIQVDFGSSEIVKLLKASLTSATPLSDVILNKTTQMEYSVIMESQPKVEKDENPNSKHLSLKVMIQKSKGKLVYAQAKEDFIEFHLDFLLIPLGGAMHLLAGKSCCKTINNLYQSTADLEHDYFKNIDMKNRLVNPSLPHGCISQNQILPLVEEGLPTSYTNNLQYFSSTKFPNGKGSYLIKRRRTYKVTDDLTVTPFCAASTLSTLNNLKIPISDVEEVELQIGLQEGLRILKASLTSTSALSDALLNAIPKPNVKPKREVGRLVLSS